VSLQPILDAPLAHSASLRHSRAGVLPGRLATVCQPQRLAEPFTPFSFSVGPIRLGLIHLFIPLTVNGIWQTRKALRTGNIAAHKASMRGMYFGGLMIAGALTFIPGRIMYRMFFG
jgi:hypothetical protein